MTVDIERPTEFVRARMFARIGALENDLRRLLADHALPYMPQNQAFGPYLTKVIERANGDGVVVPSSEELLYYLDLGDAIALVNIHRSFLPSESQSGLSQVNTELNRLVPVRNRVMHGRPLLADDPDLEQSIMAAVDQSGLATHELRSAQRKLQQQPEWSPTSINTTAEPQASVLHNLPSPDFDETGLVGRESLKGRVHRLLMSRRDRVLTLVGEGGVGKTALAVQVLYDLAFDPDCPYDAILWASLKTESLTGEGIEKIRDAGAVVLELPSLLGDAFDIEDELSWGELGDALAGIKTLVVVDNVETADANEILDVYDALPVETQFLFTSRKGLGQIERRIPVEALSLHDADRLLRLFARRRGLKEIAQLPREHISRIVARLRQMPLGIKWFVMAVEAGAQPEEVLQNQEILLRFCVQSVVGGLSSISRRVAETLYAIAGPTLFSELAVLLDVDADGIREAIQQLQQCALVTANTQPGASIQYSYVLTETATEYFRIVSPPRMDQVDDIRTRAAEMQRSEERRRVDEMRRSLGPNMVSTRDSQDASAAFLLRAALQASKRRDLDGALAEVRKAADIAPGYFEVPRVEAFVMATNGEAASATSAYERALALAQDDEQRAIVSYYYGGHSARNLHDSERAESLYRFAHEVLDQGETSLTLGRSLTYLERFEDAEPFLTGAAASLEGKARLIALTDLVNLKRRASEYIRSIERNPRRALSAALEGLTIAVKEVAKGSVDYRLNDAIVKCTSEVVRSLSAGIPSGSIDGRQAEEVLGQLLGMAAEWSDAWRVSSEWRYLVRQSGMLASQYEHAKSLVELFEGSVDDNDGTEVVTERETSLESGTVKFSILIASLDLLLVRHLTMTFSFMPLLSMMMRIASFCARVCVWNSAQSVMTRAGRRLA